MRVGVNGHIGTEEVGFLKERGPAPSSIGGAPSHHCLSFRMANIRAA
jgi:hypothetical protein